MNIHYESESIGSFYSENRVKWDDFYPSEKYIFERVFTEYNSIKTVLDVGCACGGLGRALNEKFDLDHYSGIDVNNNSIEIAKSLQSNYPFMANFVCGDISAKPENLKNKKFDLVVSLGCADFNCDTNKIIQTCWEHTANDGFFVFSFRLTNQKTLGSIDEGYQYVHFNGLEELTGNEEIAPYVVSNAAETLKMIKDFQPKPGQVLGYGNWGTPSAMAIVPYKEVVFAVFAVRKNGNEDRTIAELLLPLDLLVNE